MTYNEQLKQWEQDCTNKLVTANDVTTGKCQHLVEQFQKNTLDNIPQQFGDFLYTALGDRVTGQRSSIINKDFFDIGGAGHNIAVSAANENMTIEDYLAKLIKEDNAQPSYMRRMSQSRPTQLYLTAGRKFGVSYFTGEGDRVHTAYFGAGECFRFLTQEHVDCVKNNLKRKCVQEFLNFKNEFVDGMKALNNVIIQTPVATRLGVVSCVTKSPKINTNSSTYNDTKAKSFVVMDNEIDDSITHTMFVMQEPKVWDKKSYIDSSVAKQEKVDAPSYMSMTFLKIDNEKHTITIVANFDIGMTESAHSLNRMTNFNDRSVEFHIDACSRPYRFTENNAIRNSNYSEYMLVDCSGIALNLGEVIKTPCVYDEIKKRIDFYNQMSLKLQTLKHDNASLYFVNADI